jgi:DNA-binding HxlR family transcriptional regulator
MASTAMQRLAGMTIFDETCAGHQALALLGSKWSVLLLYAMSQGTKRYGDLQRIMPDISPKMLTQTLKELEQHEFIERTSYAETPPRVEYSLSKLGLSAMQPLALLCEWANEHLDELRSIRDKLTTR